MPDHDNNFLQDIERIQNTIYYAPRPFRTPIPAAHWDDCPIRCIGINDEWLSHLIGLLEALDQPDTWLGTYTEIQDTRDQVNEIIAAFMEAKLCCCNETRVVTNTRFTSAGKMEVSYDGGTTWEPAPSSSDPRLTIPVMPPLVFEGGDKTKCDAATNGLEHIKDVQTGVKNHLSEGLTAIELAAVLIGLLVAAAVAAGLTGGPGALIFVPLIIQIMAAIAGLAPEVYDGIFTTDVWDKTLCVLYCHIGENGQFDQAGFDAVVSDLETKLPGGSSPTGAAANVSSFVKVWQLAGLNNACSYGNAADADCSSCDCGLCQSKWSSYPDSTIFGKKSDDQTGLGDNADNKVRFETLDINTDAHYYVIVITDADADGCLLKSAADTPTSGVTVTAYNLTSSATGRLDVGNYTIGSPNADSACVSGLLFKSVAPFSIVLEFADC